MGEEVRLGDMEVEEEDGKEEGERVPEWEKGLPTVDDLIPLTQELIPPGLASAFSISPEPYKTFLDVTRASKTTFASLRGGTVPDLVGDDEEEEEEDGENEAEDGDTGQVASEKMKRMYSDESEMAGGGPGGTKRPRLVWTPQLHKRFVDVVAHLGIKNSVPKTIMQLMNVEGLTRENVASHLQKYRLYLKRMQRGGSVAGESVPEHSNSNMNSCSSEHNHHRHSSGGYHPMPVMLPMPMQMPMPVPFYGQMGNVGNHHQHYHHHNIHFDGYHSGSSGNDQFPAGFPANYGIPSHRVPPNDT